MARPRAGAGRLPRLYLLLNATVEHDSPTLLFRLGCDYLISARVIRPGPVTLAERVAPAGPGGDLRATHR
jgi:hypothetical protein